MNRDIISERRNVSPDTSVLIDTAEWLSEIFSAPPSLERVAWDGSSPGQEALRGLGSQLNASAAAEALCCILARDLSTELALHLQRRYTTLFEGIFHERAVLPYESAWHGGNSATLGGESIDAMNEVLRNLDLHVSADSCEPPDHLAIELAALAVALRGEQNSVAVDLVRRLQDWVPAFSAALTRQDADGFYSTAGELLLGLIREATGALMVREPAAAYVNEQREGEFA